MADVTLKSIRPPGGGGAAIQFQDEESNLGAPDATVVNFTGPGVTASRVGGVVTITVPGGGGNVAEHEEAVDPHPQYQTGAEVASAISTALADYPDNATVSGAISSASSADRSRSNHTGTQAQSTVDGLEAALAARPETSEVETISNAAAATAMEDHVEAADPHPQYQTEADAELWLASKNFQSLIQFADDGAALGTSGTVNEIDFVGVGVSATRVGNKITVAIDGTGDSEQVGIQFQDQGLDLGDDGTVDVIDFVGAGIEATRVGNRLTVNVSGSTASTMSGTYIASETMGGHRVVRSTGAGEVGYADSSTAGHGDDTVGITTSAVGIGENVEVLHNGYIYFIGWAWTVGQPIFLGTNGLLTQTPPSSGFVQVVGHAADTDTMFVSIETPIYY